MRLRPAARRHRHRVDVHRELCPPPSWRSSRWSEPLKAISSPTVPVDWARRPAQKKGPGRPSTPATTAQTGPVVSPGARRSPPPRHRLYAIRPPKCEQQRARVGDGLRSRGRVDRAMAPPDAREHGWGNSRSLPSTPLAIAEGRPGACSGNSTGEQQQPPLRDRHPEDPSPRGRPGHRRYGRNDARDPPRHRPQQPGLPRWIPKGPAVVEKRFEVNTIRQASTSSQNACSPTAQATGEPDCVLLRPVADGVEPGPALL